MEPVLGVSNYSSRLIPTSRPRKDTSLAEFRKIKKKTPTRQQQNRKKLRLEGRSTFASPSHTHHTSSNPSGTGVLFTVPPVRSNTAKLKSKSKSNGNRSVGSTSRQEHKLPRARARARCRPRPMTANNAHHHARNTQAQNVAERRVSVTNSTFKQYRHPLRVDGQLPDAYKMYDMHGRKIQEKERKKRLKQDRNALGTVFPKTGYDSMDLIPKPSVWPEINDFVRIKKEMPSTGWIYVAPFEIGKVIDTGHVQVKAMFPSGLGVVWVGEREDVEVMVPRSMDDQHIQKEIVGSIVLDRLRGIAEAEYGGRSNVGSFYGAGYYAARRRGAGMVRARIVVPHEYIGSCGFVVPNYVESVDAVNYNDNEGCTMYVTMKPGDEKDLIPIVAKETRGSGVVTITKKQYSADWAYYPSSSQLASPPLASPPLASPPSTSLSDSAPRSCNPAAAAAAAACEVGVLEQPSRISEAASEAYHIDFTGTHHMTHDERQILMRKLSKYCQSGRMTQIRQVLDVSPEIVEWINERGRGRCLLHYAALGGSLEVAKYLLRKGASTDSRDNDKARPIDLVEKYIRTYLSGENVDVHAQKRYRMCRALMSTTTIHRAAKDGDVDRIAFLLREYPDLLNVTNMYGMTPLHFAAMSGHVHVCQVLSDAGASWTAVNNLRQTPRDVGDEYPNIVSMYPQRLRNEKLVSQAEEFVRLKQTQADRKCRLDRSRAMQWVRATSAASIIMSDVQEQKASKKYNSQRLGFGGGCGGGGGGGGGGSAANVSRRSTSSLFGEYQQSSIAGGLDRGGSALSALPGLEFDSILGGRGRKDNNPHISMWQGSSGLHNNSRKSSSVRSSISNFEQPSINFTGKSPWWEKQQSAKQTKLPDASSRQFEKDLRARYGHVKV